MTIAYRISYRIESDLLNINNIYKQKIQDFYAKNTFNIIILVKAISLLYYI